MIISKIVQFKKVTHYFIVCVTQRNNLYLDFSIFLGVNPARGNQITKK